MKPTIKEITRVMFSMLITGRGYKEIEQAIYDLFNPPMKLITELAKSEEDCRKIAEYVGYIFISLELIYEECIIIRGKNEIGSTVKLALWNDGDVFLDLNQQEEQIYNPFQFVDFMRELGYSQEVYK